MTACDDTAQNEISLHQQDGRTYATAASPQRAHDVAVSAAIAEIAASRAGIEQAKGMLMLVYGVDADRAFEVLRWRSQQTNTKLRMLADQIVSDFVAQSATHFADRSHWDQILLTAHERIPAPTE